MLLSDNCVVEMSVSFARKLHICYAQDFYLGITQ